jgi:hypothetical protein
VAKIVVRPVEFGDWQKWNTAKPTARAQPAGGVYLLAYSHTGIAPAKATPERLPFEIVYIGNTKNLSRRPNSMHKGVSDYHEKIDTNDQLLFVATATLYVTGCNDYAVQRIYAEHIEARLVWMFTDQHCPPPVLHYDQKGLNAADVAMVIRALRGDHGARNKLAAGCSDIPPNSSR